jgi:hypothetical protein
MNNPIIYDAAYMGCIGGSSQRVFSSAVPTDYDDYLNAAKAFALAIDAAIPSGEPSGTQAELLLQICSGFWSSRFPQSQDMADYVAHVTAIVALWNEGILLLAE